MANDREENGPLFFGNEERQIVKFGFYCKPQHDFGIK